MPPAFIPPKIRDFEIPIRFAGSCERPTFRQRVISDRVMTRRRSEMSLEVIRVCAEARKQKLARLLKEHEELVRSIEVGNRQP